MPECACTNAISELLFTRLNAARGLIIVDLVADSSVLSVYKDGAWIWSVQKSESQIAARALVE